MEEILQKANELGQLLQQTEAYKNFANASTLLGKKPELKNLLIAYENLVNTLKQKQTTASIESFETAELQELYAKISENPVTSQYLIARDNYAKLLQNIQSAILIEENSL